MEIQSVSNNSIEDSQDKKDISHETAKYNGEQKAGVEFDRAEYLRKCQTLAQEYLDNPGFKKVLAIAVESGSLTHEEFNNWQQAEGVEKYELLSKLSRKINPRKTAKGGTLERSQIDEGKSLPEQLNDATLELGKSMDLDKPVEVPAGRYKAFVVHGGINQTPYLRVKFGLDSITQESTWDKLRTIHDLPQEEYEALLEQVNSSTESGKEHGTSAEILVLCGCERPLAPGNAEKGVISEAENVANYAPGAKIEYDLMNGAAESWLKDHGLADIAADFQEITGISQAGRLSGSPYAIRIYDLTTAKRDGRLGQNYPNAILSLNAPYDPTQKMQDGKQPSAELWNDRAGTTDILDMLAEVVDFEAGDKVASISHRPVSQGQRFATLNKMMPLGVDVEEGGYNSEPLFKSIRWTEACKIVSEATKVYKQAVNLLQKYDASAIIEEGERVESANMLPDVDVQPARSKLSNLGRRAMNLIKNLRSKEPTTNLKS